MQDNSLILCGRLSDNDLAYYARLCVTTDGEMVKGDGKLVIKDASYLVFALSAGTNYKNEYPNYRGELPEGKVNSAIEEFLKKGYDEVKKEAIAEYKSLFDRFYLRLQASQAPNTRINSFFIPRKPRFKGRAVLGRAFVPIRQIPAYFKLCRKR